MTKRLDIHKILIIGSGPIIIGQAAEFDYSGSQAAISLKEEGYEVILVNSNPATIMTDEEMADKVYIEPLTLESLSNIIQTEQPDAILPTLGGQIGLNLARQLDESGLLNELHIELLGTKMAAIEEAENREQFKALMTRLNQPIPSSIVTTTVDEAITFAESIGYPVIIRPAYTMGGTGGGIANNLSELKQLTAHGLDLSPVTQVLIEQSIAGFKEIEFEVMRDKNDTALIVTSMENFDPVGIHTGDSIVVAPVQTLSDRDYQMLRDAALSIIRALKIEGGVNIQMALDPNSSQYYIIEVNPRVSRSSALASKATGYPIAKMAAKIGVGLTLDEIINPVTDATKAAFEPALDYVVVKIPRWPFDKFNTADRTLGTQMKATGEVMAIGRNLEEAFNKAVRSLEIGVLGLTNRFETSPTNVLLSQLMPATDERLFVLTELIRRGITIEQLHDITKIDLFFLDKLLHIIEIEQTLTTESLSIDNIMQAKKYGFSDATIASKTSQSAHEIRQIRLNQQIIPSFKMVDTVAGEFASKTPYFYSTYDTHTEAYNSGKDSVLILGSGPIRIGQGVEFDYTTVHAAKAIQAAGYEAIIINSNPETVSTDFSISDKLYFEPLTLEDVLNVIDIEHPIGVVTQFGGQTAINLAQPLQEYGVKILGTSVADLNRAEDRDAFNHVIQTLSLPQPLGKTAFTPEQARIAATEIGYPVLIRPSYVLGGRAMEIVYNETELMQYIQKAVTLSSDHPVLIDSYLTGQEAEVDVISDGTTSIIPGIMEHIERAGIHSGDSMAVYPPQHLSDKVLTEIEDAAIKLSSALHIVGIMNVQFVIHNNTAYVIEVNPRASRTVPFISKVTHTPLAQLATKAMLGQSLADLGYTTGLLPLDQQIHVKAPVFSFTKLPGVTQTLSPEMKSTGEVMGSANNFTEALHKAFQGAGITIASSGTIILALSNPELDDLLPSLKKLKSLGYHFLVANNLMKPLTQHQIMAHPLNSVKIDFPPAMVVSTDHSPATTDLINSALSQKIPVLTSVDTVIAFVQTL